MSDFKNVMKGGWHPKGKDGGKESWRGDFKGINQVAGWMGKGKKPGGASQGSEHVSRPLATLKDPSQFGPPPKNVNYHGGAALPNEITPHTGGIGAPLSHRQIETAREVHEPAQEETDEERQHQGPPLPYRADRTGLQTSHLPPPPVHRNMASPPTVEASQSARPKPGLPPRLPSRQNSSGITAATTPPPSTYQTATPPLHQTPSTNGGLNTSALNRLGKAGVSVPGLGIGRNTSTTNDTPNPWSNEKSQSTSSPQPQGAANNTFSELSNRFARMNSNSSTPAVTAPTSPQPESPAQTSSPPSFQQSQSAFRTASNFHKDPSSVSVADAQNAAQTVNSGARSANAFREKHADSFAAAGRKANAFDQKYKVKSRFETFLDKHAPLEEGQDGQTPQGQAPLPGQSPGVGVQPIASPDLASSISRKPPPPPPPKKPSGLHGNANNAPAPPVPMSTKPTF